MRIFSTMSRLCIALAILCLCGCDLPVQQMTATERGVVFRRLPTFLGGGVGTSVASGGELVVLWPWDSIMRVDTGTQNALLGETGREDTDFNGFMFTRSKDGNEVALKMTVQFQINPDPETLVPLVQRIGGSNEAVRELIVAISRSQVRRFMNELATSHFIDDEARYSGVKNVKQGIQQECDRLLKGGFLIREVILDRFEFARVLDDGGVDRSYQEKLDERLRVLEQTQLQERRILVVDEEGQQKKNEMQGKVNRMLQEAAGVKQQAEARGNAYLAAKQNEAKGILALGKAEVEGMIEKINALAGPGGRAILRLDLAEQLQKSNSRFVLMGSKEGGGAGIEVERIDANRLIEQIGLIEAMRGDTPSQEKSDSRPAEASAGTAPAK